MKGMSAIDGMMKRQAFQNILCVQMNRYGVGGN